jgi:large subunit ribosomal protein L6|tara:strand:+ start:148 stop:681 length:534 start_codon:yes stop_codon:yes gene_type:complete
MSRVGQAVIEVPEGVEINQNGNVISAKGINGELSTIVNKAVVVEINAKKIIVVPNDKSSKGRALWGTTRALINNVVKGVSVGFVKNMEIVGVGYRGVLQGDKLSLSLGLSHPVEMEIPEGLSIKMDGNTKFTISGADKQKLGQFAAVVRSKRPPEPFKGKGIRYSDEFILRKEGKKK